VLAVASAVTSAAVAATTMASATAVSAASVPTMASACVPAAMRGGPRRVRMLAAAVTGRVPATLTAMRAVRPAGMPAVVVPGSAGGALGGDAGARGAGMPPCPAGEAPVECI